MRRFGVERCGFGACPDAVVAIQRHGSQLQQRETRDGVPDIQRGLLAQRAAASRGLGLLNGIDASTLLQAHEAQPPSGRALPLPLFVRTDVVCDEMPALKVLPR